MIEILIFILKSLSNKIEKITSTSGSKFVKMVASEIENQGKRLDLSIQCSEVDINGNVYRLKFLIERKYISKARSMLEHQQALRMIPQINKIVETTNGFIVTVDHDIIS